MTYDIITIGDCINDIFIKPCSDHFCSSQISLKGDTLFIRHGDKISVDEMHNDIGGSAANVAVGTSRLGLKSAIISMISNDSVGQKILEKFRFEGVGQTYLKINLKITSSSSIIIVFKGERTVFVYRSLKDYSQIKIPKKVSTKWIYLGPVAKEFNANYNDLISLASEKNISLAINPGHRQIVDDGNGLRRLLRVVKVLILNKQEALDLLSFSSYDDIKKLLFSLKNLGPEIVVITDGVNGAFATDGTNYWKIAVLKVTAEDPTGAGDAFASGFLANFIKYNNITDALRWGIVNSAQVVEKYGAQTNLQTVGQIEKLEKYAPPVYKI